MKNRKNYVMTKSNLTLTQSGLLPVLLKRQRHKVIELAQRRPHGRQVSTRACGSSSTTRKACSTCRAMSPCTRRTPPWNCCTPCTSTSPKVDELGSRRRRNQVHVVGECRSA